MNIFFASLVFFCGLAAEVDVGDVTVTVKGLPLILQETSKFYLILYL